VCACVCGAYFVAYAHMMDFPGYTSVLELRDNAAKRTQLILGNTSV